MSVLRQPFSGNGIVFSALNRRTHALSGMETSWHLIVISEFEQRVGEFIPTTGALSFPTGFVSLGARCIVHCS